MLFRSARFVWGRGTPPQRQHRQSCRRQVQELPFPPNDMPALILPRPKHLELVAICLSNGDMERLLRGCNALEYLRLQAINGLSTFHITSMTLRTIYVCYWCGRKTSQDVYHDMVIEDTPTLERLLVVDQEGPTRINVFLHRN